MVTAQLCVHHGPEVSIDFPDAEASFENQQRFIREQMQEGSVHADKPAIVENCLYTVTQHNNAISKSILQFPRVFLNKTDSVIFYLRITYYPHVFFSRVLFTVPFFSATNPIAFMHFLSIY